MMCVLGLLLVAGVTSAATSSPSVGGWAGSLRAVKPATSLTFSVTAHGTKRVVTRFQSTGLFKARCVGASNTVVPSIPHARVNSAGSFKAVARELAGFGKDDTWTVAGRFKSKHAASGTVAIVLALSPSKRCRFTVKWSAAYEAPAAPVAGATYKGKASGVNGDQSVSFHVSANGKELTKVSWREPPIGGNCPGQGSEVPTYTGHNVPIHHRTFTFTIHSGKISHGSGETQTNAISGRFLSGHKASGTASTVTDLGGFGSLCKGSESWIAQN
jgi:hypothetical protein